MAERSSAYLLAAGSTKTFSDHTGLLSDSITTYGAGPVENAKLYFPYAQDSHVYSWDLAAVATNDTETIIPTTGGVDVYGNTLQSTVQTKDLPSSNFFVKTTTSTYTETPSPNWRIGQVSLAALPVSAGPTEHRSSRPASVTTAPMARSVLRRLSPGAPFQSKRAIPSMRLAIPRSQPHQPATPMR